MNIKNLSPISSLFRTDASKKLSQEAQQIKSDMSHERDGNGQSQYSQNKKREKLTQEQAEKALKILLSKPFMTDMKWQAVLVVKNEMYFIEVLDLNRNLIRSLDEEGIFSVLDNKEEKNSSDQNKGQLLKRTA